MNKEGKMITVYVSGKYTAKNDEGIAKNLKAAIDHATEIWKMGKNVGCFVPHTNCIAAAPAKAEYDHVMRFCLRMVEACDVIYMLPGWEHSKGAVMEYRYACAMKKPIFTDIDELRKYVLTYEPSLVDGWLAEGGEPKR